MSTSVPNPDTPLRDNQVLALDKLTAGATRRDAAQAAGVDVRTINRWLQEPTFRAELEAATRALLRQAGHFLRVSAEDAARKLVEVLTAERPNPVHVQAARAILEHAKEYHQVLDVDERLTALEEAARGGTGPTPAA